MTAKQKHFSISTNPSGFNLILNLALSKYQIWIIVLLHLSSSTLVDLPKVKIIFVLQKMCDTILKTKNAGLRKIFHLCANIRTRKVG